MAIVRSKFTKNIIKKQLNIQDKDIHDCIAIIIDKMVDTLVDGDRIEIRGFGTFTLHYRPPRRAHNPKTGEKVLTAPKYIPHFKPGKQLRERIMASRTMYPIMDDDG